MLTVQQQEALTYFSQKAHEWRKKAEGQVPKFNVIAARNAYVLGLAKERGAHGTALDVGCGTGELVCDLATLGMQATGIDFAPDMIRLAQEKAETQGVKTEFICASMFDHPFQEASFDLIAANGFIEYISPEEFQAFLTLAHTLLRKQGVLVLGSRNRLFNAFSLNAFTEMELAAHALLQLVQEATRIAQASDQKALIADLAKRVPALPRHEAHPGTTGIGVTVRHQYTPGELVRLFEAHTFAVQTLSPVHYHAVPPRFKDAHPAIHTDLAALFQNFAGLELLPFSSTFMISASPR